MPLKKGQCNNLKGRPKGTPNKVTTTLREFIVQILDKNRKTIVNDLKVLEPKDRLAILEKLMQYAIPKQQSTQIDFSKLSEEQIDDIVKQISITD